MYDSCQGGKGAHYTDTVDLYVASYLAPLDGALDVGLKIRKSTSTIRHSALKFDN